MKLPLLIIFFGSVGVLARYYTDQFISPLPNGFPLSTFLINVVGSFCIGLLFVITTEKGWLEADFGTALMVGLLGGFTTFSAFSLQVVRLIEQQQWATALTYALLSPIGGVLAAAAGVFSLRLMR